MKENIEVTDINIGDMENSIEEDIKLLEEFSNENVLYGSTVGMTLEKYKDLQLSTEHILSDYKRVLQENKYMHNELDKQQTKINKYAKENEELKSNNEKYIIHLTDEQYKTVIENAQNDINQKLIQKVKDKIKEILKNGEYRIIFEGDAEFPDEATIITTKYLKLEKVQKLQRENERLRKQNKIMCDEYCPQIQKIKAKIEELDIAILECEYSDDDSEEYKKEVEQDKLELLKQKRVLQELLEVRK